MEKILRDDLPKLFEKAASVMDAKSEELCAMDARMGDGDLGLTMKRGFDLLPGALAQADGDPADRALMKAGMKMASAAPSTMGTLMSTGVMYGGRALGPVDAVDAAGLARFWRGFADGIAKRGKCQRGDRTILDAIGEAADRAEAVLAADPAASLETVARASLEGARAGVENTKTMVPKFGKAAVFSDKILGSPDQGAVAGLYLVTAFCEYICGE